MKKPTNGRSINNVFLWWYKKRQECQEYDQENRNTRDQRHQQVNTIQHKDDRK